jgi:UDP-N-acetylglucosamine 2-epimerase (non-hydrolysing)
MIDTLEANRDIAAKLTIEKIISQNRLIPNDKNVDSLSPHFAVSAFQDFALLTMHRPSNVDKKEVLKPIIDFLSNEVAKDMPVIWPIHPRTQNRLKEFGLWDVFIKNENIILLHPVGYHEMLKLNMDASIILTDSGGLQEESCVLGTPCLTLRWNTERPVTLRENGGASVLVGNNIQRISKEYENTLKLKRAPQRPALWDGKTAERCVRAIVDFKA